MTTPNEERTELRAWDAFGHETPSQLVAWLPLLIAWLSAAAAAYLLCPVPRFHTLSPRGVLLLSTIYVAVTVSAGAAALGIASRVHSPSRGFLLPFCGVAAWWAPLIAFYTRRSFWALAIAVFLAAGTAALAHRYHRTMEDVEPPKPVEFFRSTRLFPMILATLLIQVATVFAVNDSVRPAAWLAGAAVMFIVWHRRDLQLPASSTPPWRNLIPILLALAFVAGSLMPYLAVQRHSDASSMAAGGRPSPLKSTSQSENPTLLQAARAFLDKLLNGSAQPAPSPSNPLLQALFGDQPPTPSPSPKPSRTANSVALIAGDSYSGMILRPEVKDFVRIVPPSPKRWITGGPLNARKSDPISIPFYGAYWLFRASDQTLPRDAVESRGDPSATAFRTTDFTPMAMEARQNFGSLIDLACCKVIEVVLSNGDRRPNTVAVELILRNTRMPGQPRQSLGTLPVNSTLRWYPGDKRPAVPEVLRFRVPSQRAIQSFDEAVIRFELQSPRQTWSAQMAVDRFRLIPRGF